MNYTSKCVLTLDKQRNITSGSEKALIDAIKNGGDLRIYTEFRHNEHIDTSATDSQIIKEVSDFPATYVIDNRWVAGMMTLRQPVQLPNRFGPRPSMSYFMYNQNGLQAIARPYLDGCGSYDTIGSLPPEMFGGGGKEKPMLNMHVTDSIDEDTNAPASNFVYDFECYKFLVKNEWTEVFSHDKDGTVISGDVRLLEQASEQGCEIKVAIDGICECIFDTKSDLKHEVFLQTGSHYFYTEKGFMVAQTRPFIRVSPEIPMVYKNHNWDFGQAIVRSDGFVAGLFYDPYTLKYRRIYTRHAMRWFVKP